MFHLHGFCWCYYCWLAYWCFGSGSGFSFWRIYCHCCWCCWCRWWGFLPILSILTPTENQHSTNSLYWRSDNVYAICVLFTDSIDIEWHFVEIIGLDIKRNEIVHVNLISKAPAMCNFELLQRIYQFYTRKILGTA